jgi:DNA repair photolyase
MSLIYEPKGKAREYSPLALNVYSGGCDHGCDYCYCASIARGWGRVPVKRSLDGLDHEAEKAPRQILMCFMSDPYCAAELVHRNTRTALGILSAARCSVAILTKGGTRCLEDLAMFASWPDSRFKVGATLTFLSKDRSLAAEPGRRKLAQRDWQG